MNEQNNTSPRVEEIIVSSEDTNSLLTEGIASYQKI